MMFVDSGLLCFALKASSFFLFFFFFLSLLNQSIQKDSSLSQFLSFISLGKEFNGYFLQNLQ